MFWKKKKKPVVQRLGWQPRQKRRPHSNVQQNTILNNKTAKTAPTDIELASPEQSKRYARMAKYMLEELARLQPVISLTEDASLDERYGRVKAMMIICLFGFDVEDTIYADLSEKEKEQLRLMIGNTKKSYPEGFQQTPQLLEKLEYCGYEPLKNHPRLLRYDNPSKSGIFSKSEAGNHNNRLSKSAPKRDTSMSDFSIFDIIRFIVEPFADHPALRSALYGALIILFGGYSFGAFINSFVPHGSSFILGYIFIIAIVVIAFDKLSNK